MAPPPPPSKSYHLDLSAFSDSEEEEDQQQRQRREFAAMMNNSSHSNANGPKRIQTRSMAQQPTPAPSMIATNSSGSNISNHVIENESDGPPPGKKTVAETPKIPELESEEEEDDYDDDESNHQGNDGVDDDDDDEDDDEIMCESDAPPSPRSTAYSSTGNNNNKNKKKGKSKKKRGRKNKKRNKTAGVEAQPSEKPPRNLQTSFSEVSIRLYPRAFGEDAVPNDGGWPLGMELQPVYEEVQVLTVDEFEALKQQELHERWMSLQAKANEEVHALMEPSDRQHYYETRQWDYRERTVKNPLFGPTTEKQRQDIFLGRDDKEQEKAELEAPPSPTRRRTRSNSVTSIGSNASQSGQHDKRHKNHPPEQFNETYDQVMVHHTRNELEKLRNERSKTGCDCRKLNVYSPPKNAGCGKKANSRRLKPSKLDQELKKRHIYEANATREEKEQTLHDAVEKEPCCGSDCFCVRNGIECAMDACSCWKAIRPKKKEDPFPSSKEIESYCGNAAHGMYVVSLDVIDAYRNRTLDRIQNLGNGDMFCKPVESEST